METKTHKTDVNSIKNQTIKEKFVGREVFANVNSMVEYILTKSSEDREAPFSFDDIENYYTYPEFFGEYAKFEGGTEEERDAEIERLDNEDYDALRVELQELGERHGDINAFREDAGDNIAAQRIHAKMAVIEAEQDTLRNLETEPQEVFEWWIVSGWLCEKLKEQGYPVIESENIWGRTTTGQAILLDGVISRICSKLEILEGQKNEWK